MEDLSPKSFEGLAGRISQDPDLAVEYNNYRSNGGTEDHITECDAECRLSISCFLLNSVYIDHKMCRGKRPIDLTETLGWRSQFGIHWIFESLTDPWYEIVH